MSLLTESVVLRFRGSLPVQAGQLWRARLVASLHHQRLPQERWPDLPPQQLLQVTLQSRRILLLMSPFKGSRWRSKTISRFSYTLYPEGISTGGNKRQSHLERTFLKERERKEKKRRKGSIRLFVAGTQTFAHLTSEADRFFSLSLR